MKMYTAGRDRIETDAGPSSFLVGARLAITFAVVALLYIDPVPQSMALGILDLATSLVDHGSVVLDEHTSVDIAIRNGVVLSGMPPGASFIAALIYVLFHPLFHFVPSHLALPVLYVLCTVLVGVPAAAATVVLVHTMAVRWGANQRNALLAAGLLAFGTMHFGYATGFYKRTLAAACVFAAFTLLTSLGKAYTGPLRTGLAGVLCGLAIGLDYPSALIVVILTGYILWLRPHPSALVSFCAGAGLALLPVLFYHQAAFGSPWETPYAFRLDPAANTLGWPQPYPFVFLVVTAVAASPCLIWSVIGWRRAFQAGERRPELLVIAVIVVGTCVFYSGWATIYPHEASFPSRLLLPALPFAVLPMVFGLPARLKGWPLLIIGWSVGASVLAAQASMIPTGTIPPVYAVKVLGTSWGTGPLFSETLAGGLNLPTLHLAIAKGTTTTQFLFQPENRDLLVKLLMGQLLIKIISLVVTVSAGYLLWRFVWSPTKHGAPSALSARLVWGEGEDDRGFARRLFWSCLLLYGMYINPYIHSSLTWNYIDLAASIVETGRPYLTHTDLYAAYDTAMTSSGAASGEPLGPSLPLIPLYAALKTLGGGPVSMTLFNAIAILVLTIPAAAGIGVLIYRQARRWGSDERWCRAVGWLGALGTQIFPLGTMYTKEILGTFAVMMAYHLASFVKDGEHAPSAGRALAIGALASVAGLMVYPLWMVVPALAWYLWPRLYWRGTGALLLGVVPALLLFLVYNQMTFGQPLLIGYMTRIDPVPIRLEWPTLRMLWDLTLGPVGGWFFYQPLLVLAPLAFWTAWKRPEAWRDIVFAGGIFISLLLVYSAVLEVHAAKNPFIAATGLRYFLPAVPLVVSLFVLLEGRGRVLAGWLGMLSMLSAIAFASAGLVPGTVLPALYVVKVAVSTMAGGLAFADALPKSLGIETLHGAVAAHRLSGADFWRHPDALVLLARQLVFRVLSLGLLLSAAAGLMRAHFRDQPRCSILTGTSDVR